MTLALAPALASPCAAMPAGAATTDRHFEQRFQLTRLALFPAPGQVVVRADRRDQFFGLGNFQLPPTAKQGPTTWYAGHLHFTIKVLRLRGAGRIYVSADTDERTFAQIEFERVRTASGTALRWSTYDLFVGDTFKTVRSPTIDVSFYNYLQNQGVEPGTNRLRLHVEQFGAARAGAITVHPDSAIERTNRPPTPLALTIEPLDQRPTVGKTFRVKVTLATKTRGDVVRAVSVAPQYDPALLRLVRQAGATRLTSLNGSSSVTYAFRPRRAGRLELGFGAASNINSPRAAVFVDVLPRQTSWLSDTQHRLGLILLATGGAIVAVVLARRRRSLARRDPHAGSVT